MKTLHLLFSHSLTPEQKTDAEQNLGIKCIAPLPDALQKKFSAVPPDLESLSEYATPIIAHLKAEAQAGDVVLIQGDFGLTYLLVNFCHSVGLRAVYATTERDSIEEQQADGSIITKRVFRHKQFRDYQIYE
ncbi:MAG: hypothetical protein JJT94_00985 [Bernardetiaceae bacterium]|nr:hypothetical protein [Bernardetiaceae bacterium]